MYWINIHHSNQMHFESKCYMCEYGQVFVLVIVAVPFIFSLFFFLFFLCLCCWRSVVDSNWNGQCVHKSIHCKWWIYRSIFLPTPTTTTTIWDFIFISFIKFIIHNTQKVSMMQTMAVQFLTLSMRLHCDFFILFFLFFFVGIQYLRKVTFCHFIFPFGHIHPVILLFLSNIYSIIWQNTDWMNPQNSKSLCKCVNDSVTIPNILKEIS